MFDAAMRSELTSGILLNRDKFVQDQAQKEASFVFSNNEAFGNLDQDQITFASRLIASFKFGTALAATQAPDKSKKGWTLVFDSTPYDFDKAEVESLEDDEEGLLKYLASNEEFSALALKRVVVKQGFPQYAKQYDELFNNVVNYRRTHRDEPPEIHKKGDIEDAIFFLPGTREICVNVMWLAGLAKDQDLRSKFLNDRASGIKYDTIEDAMVFAGLEERGHDIYVTTHRKKDTPEP